MAESVLLRAFLVAGLVFFTGAVLYFGAPVIVPVVEAIVVWFVLNAMASGLRRMPFLGGVPWWAAILLSAVVVLVLGLLVVLATAATAASLGPRASALQQALDPTVSRLSAAYGVDAAALVDGLLDGLGLETMMRALVGGMIGLVSHFSIVGIYVGFLLVDQAFFGRKLAALMPDPERRVRAAAVLAQIGEGIRTYLRVMTIVSAMTAGLSYLVLLAFGVEHAFFLAATIFILNYIPTIGSIIGTVLPAFFALMQYQAVGPTLGVLAGVGLVQFVIGNIVLPRLAGTSLNLSLFVTILSLFLFGALWGVTGMFVAMPLTAMLVIVFQSFEATRPLAILLSRTGELRPGPARAAD
jgi:predicted PurR-regulated permease PerM